MVGDVLLDPQNRRFFSDLAYEGKEESAEMKQNIKRA